MHCIFINYLDLEGLLVLFFFQFYFERKKYPLNLNTRMIRNEWYPKAWEHFSPMASRYWFVQKFFFMMVKGRANKMRGNAGLLSKSWIEYFLEFFPMSSYAWIIHHAPFHEMSPMSFLQAAWVGHVCEIICLEPYNCILWATHLSDASGTKNLKIIPFLSMDKGKKSYIYSHFSLEKLPSL